MSVCISNVVLNHESTSFTAVPSQLVAKDLPVAGENPIAPVPLESPLRFSIRLISPATEVRSNIG